MHGNHCDRLMLKRTHFEYIPVFIYYIYYIQYICWFVQIRFQSAFVYRREIGSKSFVQKIEVKTKNIIAGNDPKQHLPNDL